MNLVQTLKEMFSSTSNYILGTDVSYYNGNGQTNDERSWINWSTMSNKARFTIIRGVVNGAIDSQFERNWVNAKLNKQPIGVYIYLNPRYSYDNQVKNFVKCLKDAKPELGGWIDVETSGGLTASALKNYIITFIKDVQTQVDFELGIYTRGLWWNTFVARDDFFGTLRLWIARYNTSISGPWSDSDRYRPLDWEDWTFWQFSETGVGSEYGCPLPPYGDDDIDLNYYNGTYEEFQEDFDLIEDDVDPDLELRVEALECLYLEQDNRISNLEELISSLVTTVEDIESRIEELETKGNFLTAQPIQDNDPDSPDKAVAYVINSYNDSGYPIMKKADPLRRYDYPETFRVYPDTLRTDGAVYFYREFETDFYFRVDQVNIIGD